MLVAPERKTWSPRVTQTNMLTLCGEQCCLFIAGTTVPRIPGVRCQDQIVTSAVELLLLRLLPAGCCENTNAAFSGSAMLTGQRLPFWRVLMPPRFHLGRALLYAPQQSASRTSQAVNSGWQARIGILLPGNPGCATSWLRSMLTRSPPTPQCNSHNMIPADRVD